MRIKAIWDCRIADDLINNAANILDSLLDAVRSVMEDTGDIYITDQLFFESSDNVCFCDWLYDRSKNPELADMKRELMLLLEKSTTLDDEREFEALSKAVDEGKPRDKLVIAFRVCPDNDLYVYNIERYLNAKRLYLGSCTAKNDFVDDAKMCFPHLYFDEAVYSSINTLNTSFNTIRPIIVEHLSILNEYREQLSESEEQPEDFRTTANRIYETFRIECSPQAGRQSVRGLIRTLRNDATNENEELCCELHTKLKWRGMDHNKQDRIYFHPGKPNIQNGRLIIAHIGSHV